MAKANSVLNKKTLFADLENIFPLADGQPYFGSLCNHYRGKIKSHGIDGLIESMCNNALRKVIEYYQ